MDELIDVLDSNGKFTRRTELKSYAHSMGLFHATVHIWFYTSDGKVLLQKRGRDKDTYPLLWDVSVAGHIGTGEGIKISALREIKEEIGLTISQDQLEKIGVFKSIQKHSFELIDCEFHHTYICKLKVPLKDLQKQDSEVEALKLIPLSKFIGDTSTLNRINTYVPHDAMYYKAIANHIQQQL
jgi:isopentenyl-diphosphate delta-isomerase